MYVYLNGLNAFVFFFQYLTNVKLNLLANDCLRRFLQLKTPANVIIQAKKTKFLNKILHHIPHTGSVYYLLFIYRNEPKNI